MNLEPPVIERIEEEKRKGRWNRRILTTGTVLAPLGVLIVFFASLIFSWRANTLDLVIRSTSVARDFRLIGLPFFIAIGIAAFMNAVAVYRYYNLTARPFANFDPILFDRFSNGLEGVAIAAGVDPPSLVVEGTPGLGTFAFVPLTIRAGSEPTDRYVRATRSPVVAVTDGAMGLDLYDQECEALMAHELAHIMTGDVLLPPDWSNPYGFAFLWPAILGIVSLVALVVLMAAGYAFSGWHYPFIIFFVYLVVFSPLFFGRLLSDRLDVTDKHNDLLADSIAAKMTSNPLALKSAIEKLGESGLLCRISQRRMFWLLRGLSTRRRDPSAFILEEPDPGVVAERIRNLEEIQAGRWREFMEVTDEGEIIVEADAWE